MDSEKRLSSTLEVTAALARSVYKATWQSFYTWEQHHCRQTLLSLDRAPGTYAELERLDVSGCDPSTGTTLTHDNTEDESFTVVNYRDDTHEVSTLSSETTKVVSPFRACPPYEVCTPASRNIYVGDDFEEMPFIQMADDPKFDYVPHTDDYSRFEWQLPNRDPDCKSHTIQDPYACPHLIENLSS
jgi:histone-lysine N-methyltransferase EZH2